MNRLTLEEKLNATSALVHALIQYMRQTNPKDPTIAALEDAAGDISSAFVTAPTSVEDIEKIVLDELFRGDHSTGYPLSKSALDELPNVKAALGDKPRLMSLRGVIQISARLRARGVPYVDGFVSGLFQERAKPEEKPEEAGSIVSSLAHADRLEVAEQVMRAVLDEEAAAS